MYNYVFGKNDSLSSGAPPKSGDFHQTWAKGKSILRALYAGCFSSNILG